MKLLFLIAVLIVSHQVFSQKDSLLIEVRINSIKYGDDKLNFKNPIIIIINHIDTTPIIKLGFVGGREIGMRLELLESRIGTEKIYVLGKAFFSMKSEGWKLGSAITYNVITPKIIAVNGNGMDDKDFEHCGSSYSSMIKSERFEISYLERRYIIR